MLIAAVVSHDVAVVLIAAVVSPSHLRQHPEVVAIILFLV